MTKEVIVAAGNRSKLVECSNKTDESLFELVDWCSCSASLRELPPGTPLKLVACVEPKVIRPGGAVWIKHRKFENSHLLYVPRIGTVAEIMGDQSWAIFTSGDNIQNKLLDDITVETCERRLAEEKLYGFHMEGE